MARGRDIQVPAGPSLDIQPPPALIPFVYQPAPRPSRSRSTSPVLVLRRDSAPPFREPFWTPETLHHDPPLQPRPRARSPLRRQPRPEPPVYQGTALVIPEHTRTPRQNHDMHDAPPSQRARTSGPQRRPSVRSLGPFLPESLYDERPPAAPAHLRGGDSPSGSTGWYTQRRPDSEGVMPPPGVIDGQPCQPGASAQGPAYAPMPPGPTVVQLPLLFDTLVAILRVRVLIVIVGK
ncbi:hypothetical protein OG21DRAFT_904527 [Imleria badia]|nr:hypothetical protein OG21DRAFT_904527 [Imleria badia]